MAGARRDLTMLEDRLGNPGFAVLQGDTPYLISPYAREIAEWHGSQTAASASSPSSARMWQACRRILRASDSAARLPLQRSLTCNRGDLCVGWVRLCGQRWAQRSRVRQAWRVREVAGGAGRGALVVRVGQPFASTAGRGMNGPRAAWLRGDAYLARLWLWELPPRLTCG